MGCCQANASVQVTKQRRRLSVGEVHDDGNDTADAETAESDRGLITSLQQEDVVKMLSAMSARRASVVNSMPDQGSTSFANKTMQMLGEEIDPVTTGLGYTCRKGLKPESPNQDSWTIVRVDDNYAVYGVFDGHGQKGHDISNFVKEYIPKLIVKDTRFRSDDMPQMLVDLFRKTQGLISHMDQTKKLSAQMSGTTATVVIHDLMQNKLTIGHVADSTAVLGEWVDSSKSKTKGRALTRDHKPDLKDEKARIEKAGGRVVFDGYANHRVYAKNGRYPGLNMSRCLGDLLGHQDAGCIADPETSELTLDPSAHVLLLCSDGVWEFITADEAVALVSDHPPAKAMLAAERLAKEAWDRWIREEGGSVVDDITCILVHLNVQARGH